MPWKHYFTCRTCKTHLTYVTDHELMIQPGKTHEEALANGAQHMAQKTDIICSGLGLINYCSGFDISSGKNCTTKHVGSHEIVVRKQNLPPVEWTNFCEKVDACWKIFVASNYNLKFRGANNYRNFAIHKKVREILQTSGGTVHICNATYTICESKTAEVSLHRSFPKPFHKGNAISFIFHL